MVDMQNRKKYQHVILFPKIMVMSTYAILRYLQKGHIWYAFLGFCRPVKGICGLTREIIVGLVANLETRQQCREEYTKRDLPLNTQGLPPQMMLKG